VIVIEHQTNLRHLGDTRSDDRIGIEVFEGTASIDRGKLAGGNQLDPFGRAVGIDRDRAGGEQKSTLSREGQNRTEARL
jgi:hypothetical protein